MTSPSPGFVGRHGGEGRRHNKLVFSCFFECHRCKNPPRCLFTVNQCLRPHRPHGRRSCVEYNFRSHPSVRCYVFVFYFSISARCRECMCNIVLQRLCTQRGQCAYFAARLWHNSLFTPLTAEYETRARYQDASVSGPAECGRQAAVCAGLVKRQILWFQTDIIWEEMSYITPPGVVGPPGNFHISFCFPQCSSDNLIFYTSWQCRSLTCGQCCRRTHAH